MLPEEPWDHALEVSRKNSGAPGDTDEPLGSDRSAPLESDSTKAHPSDFDEISPDTPGGEQARQPGR